jgi:branched-chain amino acid transport system substrate-binding protein
MAAWENVFILKDVMESEKVLAKPDTVQADRRKIRDGLAKLTATEGLLGTTKRAEREAEKPFVFVRAKNGQWAVYHNPL